MDREVRKIQLTGKSTYIISLPKKWVDELGLKAGNPLAITRQDATTLLITPEEKEKETDEPSQVDLRIAEEEPPEAVIRKIIALYFLGYGVIRVIPKSGRILSNQRTGIKDFVRRKLVGTEVVSDSSHEINLQVLLGYAELSVENALRRMFLLANSMHEDAISALKEHNVELAEDVIRTDDEVDRFSFYIIRQLKYAIQNERAVKEIGLLSARDCLGYRLIAKSVERIADHAVKIAENVVTLKAPPDQRVSEKIYEASAFAKNAFSDAVTSLFKRDYELAEGVVSRGKKAELMMGDISLPFAKGTEADKTGNLRMILESIRRTIDYATDIAEVVLNLTVENVVKT
jgi:phosphate uptake regulator